MSLIVYTFDWLPEFPRGFVRDLRVRWALEEIGRPYEVATVPLSPKSDEHRGMQPFGQVPMIRDGELTLFESGAILLHLSDGTPLLPAHRRAEVIQWLIAALNSVEITSSVWMEMTMAERMPDVFGSPSTPEAIEHARQNMNGKLDALEKLMTDRNWIAGTFTAADIMMVDVLRIPQSWDQLNNYPALTDYVDRATARPAFRKAMADHMAHWQAADRARRGASA
ncbi:glutathione S-transferase family protein [Pseudaminobacter sp. NGMCC 1.201702]|uniref:glutathione S-transferase family protein n=1 Tax=Pseudaminobacter sp. NGMCC 1.201702 TaxID=3391825 RepID=UPI0039EEBC5A